MRGCYKRWSRVVREGEGGGPSVFVGWKRGSGGFRLFFFFFSVGVDEIAGFAVSTSASGLDWINSCWPW